MKRLALVVSNPALRADLQRSARAAGYVVESATESSRDPINGCSVDAALVDVSAEAGLEALESLRRDRPSLPIVALASDASFDAVIRARRAGAQEVLCKPFDVKALEQCLASAMPLEGPADSERFLTREPAVMRLLEGAERAAASDATICIRGESGTGKELLARWIHQRSPRRAGPFVVVSCAGLSESLAESELFGHVEGAFTGAVDSRLGQVRSSSGGTLVLDDVSELGPSLQPKLLRVLQEQEVMSVGASRPSAVDLRVIATTQRDLTQEVESGRFREDLFYRLDVIEFEVPPLRERPHDIELLATTLLRSFAQHQGSDVPYLGAVAVAALRSHPFRGNVRELSNLMRRAALLFAGREVDAEVLLSRGPVRGAPVGRIESLNLRDLERDAIIRALAARSGNRTQAAKVLGISVRTLRNKIQRYGLAAKGSAEREVPSDWLSA